MTVSLEAPFGKTFATVVRIVGHCGFAALAVMSLLLAGERVIYIDSAAQLFEMLVNGDFVFYDHRYTMAVTQLLPLLMIKTGLPLSEVVAGYAVAAPLLGWTVYCIIVYGFKDVRVGLLLLLPLLCMRHTFFHGISETFSLAIYATLLLALLRHVPCYGGWRRVAHALGVAVCVLACVFMHPIGMFYAFFLLGYHWLNRRLHPTLSLFVGVAALVAAVAVKMSLGSNHDAEFIPSMPELMHRLRYPAGNRMVGQFASRLGDFYIYPVVLYVMALAYRWRRRQWLRLACGVGFNAAFFAMTLVVYYAGDGAVGVERAFLPLAFFAGVPALCEVVPSMRRGWQGALLGLYVVLLALSMAKIAGTSRHYTQRLEEIEAIAAEGRCKGVRKMLCDEDDVRGLFDIASWGVGFESVLASSLAGPDSTVSIYIDKAPLRPDDPEYRVRDAMLGVPWWRLWYYNALPDRYFRLPEVPYSRVRFVDGEPVFSPLEED